MLSVADFLFPPKCLLCKNFIIPYNNGDFCEDCLDNFNFFNNSPICPKCGILFKSNKGKDHLCSKCAGKSHSFDKARSVGPFEGTLRKAIHDLKYSNKSMLADPLGKILAAYAGLMLNIKDYEIILPVPLHFLRLRERSFNQSLMLSRRVGKIWNIPVNAESLKRLRQTKPQTSLSHEERHKNVRGAFSFEGNDVRGKKVLLVDDVYTSGSTVDECARVLKKHGALKVDVLTLARTR